MAIFVHYSMLCMVLDILIILTWNTDREKWTDRQVPASALTLTGRSIVKSSQNNNKHSKTMHKNSSHCTVYSTDPKQYTPIYRYIYNISTISLSLLFKNHYLNCIKQTIYFIQHFFHCNRHFKLKLTDNPKVQLQGWMIITVHTYIYLVTRDHHSLPPLPLSKLFY